MLFSAKTLATVSAAALIGLGEATSSSQSNSSSYLDGYTTPSTIYPGLTAGLGDPRVILPNTGVQVQGIVPADYPNINAFLGIPYGQPPVGALRFTPPQAYDYQSYHSSNTSGKVRSGRQSVNGDILADQLPPSCMQWLGNDTGIYNVDVTEFSIRGPISEDCLTLSMWTPRNASAGTYPNGGGYGNGTGKAELLPVLVFIPGGAFTTGGQNVPYQIPEKLVARRQDVIVVTINYRLNIFGFPNSKGLNEQNLGLLDQRVALEWVANNVEAFGGDPKRVVLWGQSAGAASVDYYAHTYPTDPLVRGFAMDSGTTYLGCCRSQDSNQTQFSYVASVFNCANSDPAAELACMRTVPADLLTNFLREHANAATAPSLSFDPIVDDKVVFANYTQRVASGGLAKVPAIIGSNTEDSGSISLFLCPLLKTISNRALANQTTYRYLYGGNFTNISPKPSFGAYHSSELPLLFGTYGDFRGNSSALEIQTSEAMQDAYVSFAASGAPAGWPAYDAMRTGGLPTSRLVKVWARNGTAQQVLMDAGAGEKALEDGCATTALTYPDS